MKLRNKLIVLLLQAAALVAIIWLLPKHQGLLPLYDQYIFYPFQSLRGSIFGVLGFSIGDVIYALWGIGLLITIVKWVIFIVRFRTHKGRLAVSVLNTINTVLFVYLFFLFGWGANYYKPSLSKSWGLSSGVVHDRKSDSAALIAFNTFLVGRLNTYAPHYHYLSFRLINQRSKEYYRLYTDSKVRLHGLNVKPTLFGYFLELAAADGYYNPFTGEGQANDALPSFELPFIVCHEMAHQAGIAAEGDANLMAYALGTLADDSSFNYSAYLNIWLYADARLYRRDSVLAKNFEARLNALTKAHIDTLEQLSLKYQNSMTQYSKELYNGYLKMQQQKDGIRSYGNVAASAWLLEQKRKNSMKGIILIP